MHKTPASLLGELVDNEPTTLFSRWCLQKTYLGVEIKATTACVALRVEDTKCKHLRAEKLDSKGALWNYSGGE